MGTDREEISAELPDSRLLCDRSYVDDSNRGRSLQGSALATSEDGVQRDRRAAGGYNNPGKRDTIPALTHWQLDGLVVVKVIPIPVQEARRGRAVPQVQ